MSYLLRKIAFDKYAADAAMDQAEQDHINNGTETPKKTIGDRVKEVGKNTGDFFKSLGSDIWSGAKQVGEHISDNGYAYSGGAIGAAAGVPVGLGIAELTGMSATEKVLTTILSSAALAGTGAYVGHKYDGMPKKSSYKYAADEESTAGSKAYNKFKGGVKAVGDHLSRNKGKYIGGALGAAAAVPVGAAISESFGMRPTEKLITMIATGLATTGSGVAIGHYMDTKK